MLVSLFCKPFLEKEKQRCRLPLLASWPLTTLLLVFGRCKVMLVYKINQMFLLKFIAEYQKICANTPLFGIYGLQNKLYWFTL